jgi:hypothetical protein
MMVKQRGRDWVGFVDGMEYKGQRPCWMGYKVTPAPCRPLRGCRLQRRGFIRSTSINPSSHREPGMSEDKSRTLIK